MIRNHTDWLDVSGLPVSCHESGLARFDGLFYWYGTDYTGNPSGKFGYNAGDLARGLNVYTSPDLVAWTRAGVALPRPASGPWSRGTLHRPHVLRRPSDGRYVMWFFHFRDRYPDAMACVALADHPAGPFTPVACVKTASPGGCAQDLQAFQDADGRAYLVYDDGARNIRVERLTDDYLGLTGENTIALHAPQHEAPAMVRLGDRYLVAGSGVDGWNPTETHYATAAHPLGPYGEKRQLSRDRTWGGQITDLHRVAETGRVICLCDQWWQPDRAVLDRSRYLWLELTYDATTDTAALHPHAAWDPLARPANTVA